MTPSPVDMLQNIQACFFFRFLCVLFSFCARKFQGKYETQEPRKIIVEYTLQSGYFTIRDAVAFGMGIKDKNILLYHIISWGKRDKEISTREFNISILFTASKIFSPNCGIPDLNILSMAGDDSPLLNKIYHYLSDMIPDTITFTSKKYYYFEPNL